MMSNFPESQGVFEIQSGQLPRLAPTPAAFTLGQVVGIYVLAALGSGALAVLGIALYRLGAFVVLGQ